MGSISTNVTPAYGQRNFVDLIDERALNEPSRIVISIPRSASDASQGWEDLSYKDYANAINRWAHWMVKIAGQAKEGEYPTVAYIGPNDVRYFVALVGAIKAGYKLLLISPRNNLESQVSLFEATDCSWILHTPEYTDAVQSWLPLRSMTTHLVPGIAETLSPEPVPAFPFQKPYHEIDDKPALVLHTSGSTGTPKPIVVRYGTLAVVDAYHLRPEFAGQPHFIKGFADDAKRVLCTMPLFHALGIYFFIGLSLFWGTPVLLSCADQAVTPDAVLSFINHSKADGVVLPPSVVAEMSGEKSDIDVLKTLQFVTSGGGAMEAEAGDRLVEAGVKFSNLISTTEYGVYPLYRNPDYKEWRYITFDDETFGAEYRPVDDAFEQVIVRRNKKPGMQGIFYTFPELDEYHTKDLYKPHPQNPHQWLHCGRADDVIAFSNGEKLNPVTIEQAVGAHPALKQAIVVGQGKFQAGIFLEPLEFPKDEAAAQALIDSVWPIIEHMNERTVAHGRIARDYVALSDPTKPIPSSAKGSLQRGAFLKIYSDEINAIYDENKKGVAVELSLSSKNALIDSIKKLISQVIGVDDIEPDHDFFGAGIDSLGFINLARLLGDGLKQAGVPADRAKVTAREIYANSTIDKLSAHLLAQASQNEATTDSTNGVKASQDILEEYSIVPIKGEIPEKPAPNDKAQTVILTGSTGSLGSYLLHQLEESASVAKIVALNRGPDGGRQRQIQANEERGLTTTFSKTEFLQADLSQPNLGLDSTIYQRLLSTADRIIHNAWPVNFNLSVESFTPNIHGVRNLAEFSFKASKRVAIAFLSSIGSADLYNGTGPVPETSLPEFSFASTGYGQSKLVGDLILQQATQNLGVPAAIIRVGQISGPRSDKGAWNRHEWLPTIVSSSVALGKLPLDLGANSTVDWVPVEDVASVILEISGVLVQQPLAAISGHFHIVNPAHVQWPELAPAVKEFYEQQGRKLEIVDFVTWVKAVEQGPADGAEVPAVKLLDTYKALAEASASEGFATAKTQGVSKTLNQLGPINAQNMKVWCQQWRF